MIEKVYFEGVTSLWSMFQQVAVFFCMSLKFLIQWSARRIPLLKVEKYRKRLHLKSQFLVFRRAEQDLINNNNKKADSSAN